MSAMVFGSIASRAAAGPTAARPPSVSVPAMPIAWVSPSANTRTFWSALSGRLLWLIFAPAPISALVVEFEAMPAADSSSDAAAAAPSPVACNARSSCDNAVTATPWMVVKSGVATRSFELNSSDGIEATGEIRLCSGLFSSTPKMSLSAVGRNGVPTSPGPGLSGTKLMARPVIAWVPAPWPSASTTALASISASVVLISPMAPTPAPAAAASAPFNTPANTSICVVSSAVTTTSPTASTRASPPISALVSRSPNCTAAPAATATPAPSAPESAAVRPRSAESACTCMVPATCTVPSISAVVCFERSENCAAAPTPARVPTPRLPALAFSRVLSCASTSRFCDAVPPVAPTSIRAPSPTVADVVASRKSAVRLAGTSPSPAVAMPADLLVSDWLPSASTAISPRLFRSAPAATLASVRSSTRLPASATPVPTTVLLLLSPAVTDELVSPIASTMMKSGASIGAVLSMLAAASFDTRSSASAPATPSDAPTPDIASAESWIGSSRGTMASTVIDSALTGVAAPIDACSDCEAKSTAKPKPTVPVAWLASALASALLSAVLVPSARTTTAPPAVTCTPPAMLALVVPTPAFTASAAAASISGRVSPRFCASADSALAMFGTMGAVVDPSLPATPSQSVLSPSAVPPSEPPMTPAVACAWDPAVDSPETNTPPPAVAPRSSSAVVLPTGALTASAAPKPPPRDPAPPSAFATLVWLWVARIDRSPVTVSAVPGSTSASVSCGATLIATASAAPPDWLPASALASEL